MAARKRQSAEQDATFYASPLDALLAAPVNQDGSETIKTEGPVFGVEPEKRCHCGAAYEGSCDQYLDNAKRDFLENDDDY